ncbi:MAG: hypothetical protein GY841_23130 [FCB group bacterium]|nr:hypothetical protein [FCB group bacterium]
MLTSILKQKKQAVLDGWFSQIIDTYPSGSTKFLAGEKDRFANPVGSTFRTELEIVYDAFLSDMNTECVAASFDRINRIRAVQDFSASQAVAFIFFLKTVIRRELAEEISGESGITEEILALESRIDTLALLAFDSFMLCRERLFEVRCNDIKRQASLATARTVKTLPSKSEGDQ